jgi:selenocysteine lyase/cysteine desulfurase
VLFFVDAIQGLGAIPLDVGKTPIDFLASGGHKWLLGPKGAGLFWVRPEMVERLHPVSVGWNSVVHAFDFTRVELNLKPDARRWESGTMDLGAVLGLGASIELLLGCGIDNVWRRIILLTDHLCRRAEQVGCRVYSSRTDQEKSGIVSLETPREPAAVVKQCRREGIVVNHRSGRLRVSPHCYNTLEEIDRLVHILGNS